MISLPFLITAFIFLSATAILIFVVYMSYKSVIVVNLLIKALRKYIEGSDT